MVKWSNKMSLAQISSSTKIWHLSMEKRTFVEAVGLQHHIAQTHGKSPRRQPQSLPGLGASEKQWLRISPVDERAFVEVPDFSAKVPSLEEQNPIVDILEGTRRKLCHYLCLPSTKWHSSVPPKPGLRRFHRIYILTASQTPLNAGPWATWMPHPRSPQVAFPLPSVFCWLCLHTPQPPCGWLPVHIPNGCWESFSS